MESEPAKINSDSPVIEKVGNNNACGSDMRLVLGKKTEDDVDIVNSVAGTSISKRQLKKEEKKRSWEAAKRSRRENRREKKKVLQLKKKERLEKLKLDAIKDGLDPSAITNPVTRKKLKSNSIKNSLCKVGLCVDMSFADLMVEKDLHMCIKQLSRCYSVNRRFKNPMQFYITSLDKKYSEVMDKHDGWKNWDVNFHEKSYLELEAYPKDKIVYLTAESENVLMEPENDTLYVIGGLVDHNFHKGLCHKLALENGVKHARLPLPEYIVMNRRKVLSILHVFEIVGSVAQGRSWKEVLMEVLPSRNQAKLKGNSSDDDGSSYENNVESETKISENANIIASEEKVVTPCPIVKPE